MLVNHTDTVLKRIARGCDDLGLAVNKDLAFVGVIDAREHVHKSGLAASVLAKKR